MGYIGNPPAERYTSIDKQTITGDGTVGPYTLTHSVGNAQEIEVFVNNVRQEPAVAYTVAADQLTMTGTVDAVDDFYVVFQGKAKMTATHPSTFDLTAANGTFTGDLTVDTNTLYVDSTNNRVGIGTTSPNKILHLETSGETVQRMVASTTNLAGFYFGDSGNGSIGQLIYDNSSDAMRFNTNGAERLRITSAGNVGIGTNSPVGELNIDGRIVVDDGARSNPTGGASLVIDYQTTSDIQGRIRSRDWDGSTWKNLTVEANNFIIKNDVELMRVTSAGNVGIGETAPANLLHVKESDTGIAPHASAQIVLEREGTNYLQFLTAETGTSGILFGDGSDVDVAQIKYDHNTTSMQFVTEASEAMRIDSSGNLLVGTTNELPAINNVEGIALSAGSYGGRLEVSRDNNEPVSINRKTSDGSLMSFKKDGTTVGSIGYSSATNIAINNANSKGLGIGSASIFPTNGSTGLSDAGLDLGYSSSRFKDLYLSGGVYLGGTGSANYLDDYEEGTFTPTYQSSGGGESITYDNQLGTYTKIGRKVFFKLVLGTDSISGGTGNIRIGGLPFTIVSGDNSSGYVGLLYSFASNIEPAIWIVNGGTTLISLYKNDNVANVWNWSNLATGGNSNRLYMVGSYNVS